MHILLRISGYRRSLRTWNRVEAIWPYEYALYGLGCIGVGSKAFLGLTALPEGGLNTARNEL